MPAAASEAGTTARLPPTGDARMVPHLSRDGAASDPARRQADSSAADAVPPTIRLRLEAIPDHPLSTAARRRSMADAVGILDDVRRRIGRDPEGARAAALRLVALLTPPGGGEPSPMRGGLAPWQKRKIDRYIQQRLERTLRVKELAEQVSLSVSHFCRAFRESFGASPHLHLTRLRVERAQRLMLTTQDPLSQIALACGMADQAHLSKLFRREVGEPPNTWRRRNKTGAEAHGRSGRSIKHASDPANHV
jgi:AraC-like DNA-binding protein